MIRSHLIVELLATKRFFGQGITMMQNLTKRKNKSRHCRMKNWHQTLGQAVASGPPSILPVPHSSSQPQVEPSLAIMPPCIYCTLWEIFQTWNNDNSHRHHHQKHLFPYLISSYSMKKWGHDSDVFRLTINCFISKAPKNTWCIDVTNFQTILWIHALSHIYISFLEKLVLNSLSLEVTNVSTTTTSTTTNINND